MYRKTKKKYLVGLLALLAFCTACGGPAAQTGRTEQLEQEGAKESQAAQGGEGEKLEMLAQGLGLVQGGGSDAGFYYVEPRPENMLEGNIRYVDYASGQDVYLSSQVNSDHAGEEDPSYLDSIIGACSLFVYRDQLFFLRGGVPDQAGESEFGEKASSALYRMELDGSQRTRIYVGDGAAELLPYAMGGENALYLFRQGAGGIGLLKLLPGGGEAQVLETFEPGSAPVGCAGSRIVFSVVGQLSETREMEMRVFCYDLRSGTRTDIVNSKDSGFGSPIVMDDCIYFITEREAEVYSFDGELLRRLSLEPAVPATAKTYEKIYAVGTDIFMPCYDSTSESYYTGILRTADESFLKTSIPFHDSEKNVDYGAVILAGTAEQFLVLSQRDLAPHKMQREDGTTVTVTLTTHAFSTILKEDYFASRTEGLKRIVRQE